MREIRLRWFELLLIGATRGMLGAGLGLLLSGKLSRDQRVAAGCTLSTIGLVSTIPLAIRVMRRRREVVNGHSRSMAGSTITAS